jgi:hypothetical protein
VAAKEDPGIIEKLLTEDGKFDAVSMAALGNSQSTKSSRSLAVQFMRSILTLFKTGTATASGYTTTVNGVAQTHLSFSVGSIRTIARVV